MPTSDGVVHHNHSISSVTTDSTNLNQQFYGGTYVQPPVNYSTGYTCGNCGMWVGNYAYHQCTPRVQVVSVPAPAWDYQKEQMRQELAEIKELLRKLVDPTGSKCEEVHDSAEGRGGDRDPSEEGSVKDCPNLTSWPPRKRS